MQIFGHITEAGTTKRRAAALLVDEAGQQVGTLYLAVEGRSTPHAVTILEASSGIGNGDWRLTLSTGDAMHLPAGTLPSELLAFMPGSAQRESRLSRLENVRWRGVLILGVILLALGYGMRLSIAPAGDFMARLVPQSTSEAISRLVLQQLDRTLMAETNLDTADQQRISAEFDLLLTLAPEEFRDTRLHFRKSELIGPNAFALPGKDIILLDELISFADDPEIVTAVLAHELGHVINQHALRHIMRSAVFTLGVSIALGSEETLIEEAASFGGALILASQGREFELEADQTSATMMRTLGKDPAILSTFFQQIIDECGALCDGGGYFDSHPSFDQRIEAITD